MKIFEYASPQTDVTYQTHQSTLPEGEESEIEEVETVIVIKPRIPLVRIAEFYAQKLGLLESDAQNHSLVLIQDALIKTLAKKV